MPDDPIRLLLRLLGGRHQPAQAGRPVDAFDLRLDRVEREQREIEARLELLERQADPRGVRRDD